MLSRQEISDAVTDLGWRYVLGLVRTSVRVGSLAQGVDVAARAVAVAGRDAEAHLWLDVRRDRVVLSLQTLADDWVTPLDLTLARQIAAAVGELGLRTDPDGVEVLEIAIDALDIPSVLPFWRAVLGYVDQSGALVDPMLQRPAVWFQQMDAPRPQRNRIHLDVSVPHDEADRRIKAALAAGGTLLSDAEAPAFWVLADPEGNEACVTTWQGRD